jgi:hypothetical protein
MRWTIQTSSGTCIANKKDFRSTKKTNKEKAAMKTNLIKIGTLMAVCLMTFSARAFILFQDNFPYGPGILSNAVWVAGAGNSLNTNIFAPGNNTATIGFGTTTSDQPRVYFTNGYSSTIPAAVNFPHTVYYFPSNSPAAALYSSFTINLSGSASSGTYVAYFTDTNFDYAARIYTTNGPGGSGYQLAVQDLGTFITTNFNGANLLNPVVLTAGQNYQVVVRYINNLGLATLWVNPTAETFTGYTNGTGSTSVTCTGPAEGGAPGTSLAGYGLRNASGGGKIIISNLAIGTTFADVVPSSAGSNPPFMALQPQGNTNLFAGGNFTNSALAGGDLPLSYQWYFTTNSVTTPISFGTNATLPLTGLVTNQTGSYYVVVTNIAGVVTSSVVNVLVSAVPVAPTFSSPTNAYSMTNIIGDTVNLTVAASGVPSPSYQWYFVTNSMSGNVTNPVSGATSTTLTLTGLTTNQAGGYFVTATNLVGKTNSPLITLVVNPIPIVTIASARSMVNGSYNPTNASEVIVTGIVTSWTNTTSSGNCEFYIQDSTAGIAVFWNGANGTNTPPAGASVQVTAPLENPSFNGLVSLQPYYTNTQEGVKILSTNNPLPTPQPFPFDPNVTTPQLKAMESSYFVASNVFLTAASTFTSANQFITNIAQNVFTDEPTALMFTNHAGDTFTMYVNPYVGISGQSVPAGPVTVFGVLGYSSLSSGNGGFELTPTRYADIISYVHLTNVLSNARKGDLATNTYSELVVRPGETLTTYASIGDAAGGSVTLTPTGTLPTGAYWTNIVNGLTATATLVYTGNSSDAGNQFTIQLNVTSTAGTSYTESFTVYVPTAQEQQIAITEFLANPTTNTALAFFNPLQRSSDTTGISTNDQYVEIANQSPSDLSSEFTLDEGNALNPVFDSFGGGGTTLQTSNSLVIYGGAGSASPGISPAKSSIGLFLPTTGSGLLVLRDQNGYIIDRVVYSASSLSTNGSLSRFPTINDAFVPQAYISTNLVTPTLQYDGGSWSNPTKVPTGVTNVAIAYVNGKAVMSFTANTTQASTLWNGSTVGGPYSVIYGQPFPSGIGSFTNVNSATKQFYFITTQ